VSKNEDKHILSGVVKVRWIRITDQSGGTAQKVFFETADDDNSFHWYFAASSHRSWIDTLVTKILSGAGISITEDTSGTAQIELSYTDTFTVNPGGIGSTAQVVGDFRHKPVASVV